MGEIIDGGFSTSMKWESSSSEGDGVDSVGAEDSTTVMGEGFDVTEASVTTDTVAGVGISSVAGGIPASVFVFLS